MKNLYITCILLCSAFATGFSCSCAYVPTFCESITYLDGTIDSNYVIVHAEVLSKNNSEMELRMLTHLFGTPSESVLTVPQGYGADCRESIGGFNVGSEYVFAFWGRSDGGYNLSICGVNWLNVSGNEVVGSIAPGIDRIRIADFGELQDCGNLGSTLTFIDVTPTFTSGDIEVSTTRDIEGINIAMYDMIGRLVYAPTSNVLLESAPLVIPGIHFPSGCYAIVTEVKGIRRVFRVMIVS